MSLFVRKPPIWVSNVRISVRAVQLQAQARSLKIRINEEEELYYPCSLKKSADHLCRGSY